MKRILSISILALIFVSCGPKLLKPKTQAVDTLDLAKFAGTWYEIAGLATMSDGGGRDIRYVFTLTDENSYQVECTYVDDGGEKHSSFKLQRSDSDAQGCFKKYVFGPFYSDYRVLMIAEDYSWAVVGSKKADRLGILGRTTQIPSDDLYGILFNVSRLRYDTDMLTWVRHGK